MSFPFISHFFRHERHLARLRGLATYHLIAPLRLKLDEIERRFDQADEGESWELYEIRETLRMVLRERERAELERGSS